MKSFRFISLRGAFLAKLISVLLLYAALPACEDPPPPPEQGAFLLAIRTQLPDKPGSTLSGGTNEDLSGVTGLVATVTRIDVVHRTAAGDPSTERIVTIDSTVRAVQFLNGLDVAERQIGFFNVPIGYVMQVRVITESARISLRGQDYDVKIPSGSQSGIKIDPIDGVPFEILTNERTAARIVIEPFKQLIRNKGQGFLMKPELKAEHAAITDISPIYLDRVVVGFKDGVNEMTIQNINNSIGSTIIDRDTRINYYILRIPTSITLDDAISYYHDLEQVNFVLPDNHIFMAQVKPCDPLFQDPGPFTQVKAPEAWRYSTGSTYALMAVIDTGFHMTNQDLYLQYNINQNELSGTPGVRYFDKNLDGTVTPDEVRSPEFDKDNDGIITFRDLNHASLKCLCAGPPMPASCDSLTCDKDGDGKITPVDLVNGNCPDGNCMAGWGFQDGKDNDTNGRVDDLVGWDFRDNDNLPKEEAPEISNCDQAHGTEVTGIMAAIGTPPSSMNMCMMPKPKSDLTAGMNWSTRLIPIRIAPEISGNVLDPGSRGKANLGLSYAAALGADVINTSFVVYYSSAPAVCDYSFIGDLKSDKFSQLKERLPMEWQNLQLGRSIVVTAAGNCPANTDLPEVFTWPAKLNTLFPNMINVGGIKTGTNSWDETFSSFGPATIHIAAPSTNWITLSHVPVGANVTSFNTKCRGTSLAAPLVSGTIGLMISYDNDLKRQPDKIIKRLLCNAAEAPELAGLIGGGSAFGRILDVEAAVINSRGCQ